MSSILGRVTRGRIRKGTTKAVLVLAVAGALYFVDYTTTPPDVEKKTLAGGGRTKAIKKAVSLSNAREKDKELLEKILIEDSELVAIVQVCLKMTIF